MDSYSLGPGWGISTSFKVMQMLPRTEFYKALDSKALMCNENTVVYRGAMEELVEISRLYLY